MPDVFDSLRSVIESGKTKGASSVAIDTMEGWLAEIERLQVRAGNIKQVFIVSLNFGCEGHNPPTQAFLSEQDATAARKLFEANGHCDAEFFAVPVWPEPAVRWMDQKPIGHDEP